MTKTKSPTVKELSEEIIFLRKLVTYHEGTIAALQARNNELEATSKQMQHLLSESAKKLVQLEEEKGARPRNPLHDLLPSRQLK